MSPFAFMSCEGRYWDKKPKSRGCPCKNVFIENKNKKLYGF
jgi:CRISPR/Cas system-associated protein Cas5 (RAMP superfamily)